MTVNLWLGFTTSCDILGIVNKSKMASPGCKRNQLELKVVGINKLLQMLSLRYHALLVTNYKSKIFGTSVKV